MKNMLKTIGFIDVYKIGSRFDRRASFNGFTLFLRSDCGIF